MDKKVTAKTAANKHSVPTATKAATGTPKKADTNTPPTKPAVAGKGTNTPSKISGGKPANSPANKPVNSPANKPQNSPAIKAQNPPKEEKPVQKAPEEKKIKVEQIKLIDLFKKIEEYRDNNRSLLIIDKLEQNDSTVFFKYQGIMVDVPEYIIKEKTNVQTRDKSVEGTRKSVVSALRSGSAFVIFVDKILSDLQEFYKESTFFSPHELFVPSENKKTSYYQKKLLKEDEDVDGFGNKGGYNPHKNFSTSILSKALDQTPDQIISKLNLPVDLFDCIVIS